MCKCLANVLLTIDPHVGASPANGSLAPSRSLLLYEGGTVGTRLAVPLSQNNYYS